MGREAGDAVGNTKATLQKEPVVTQVTLVPAAALQACLRAGCQRKAIVNEAQQRHRQPAKATSDREIENDSTSNT